MTVAAIEERSIHGKIHDIRRDAGDQSYSVEMACTNCAWSGSVMISKGRPVPRPHTSLAHCPTCGCLTLAKTVDQKPRL